MRKIIRTFLRSLGFDVQPSRHFSSLERLEQDADALMDRMLAAQGIVEKSRAQLKQDIFVLLETGFKRGGYFVEFGATNGVDLSNSWLLEKVFCWTGILAEPATIWHDDLKQNRTAIIDTRCVWSQSGVTLDFTMADAPEFSTLSTFRAKSTKRDVGASTYAVETISLLDLLQTNGAPAYIDYLSVDTEGSEFDILKDFDFSKFQFGVITIEHNYNKANRDRLYALLTSKGYIRKYQSLSRWDDWYVKS
jgi:FkbM family methyltransferase